VTRLCIYTYEYVYLYVYIYVCVCVRAAGVALNALYLADPANSYYLQVCIDV